MSKDDSIKKTVTIGLSTAIFFVLSCFASIPVGFNVRIEIAAAFLAFIAFAFGPMVGFYVGLIGHTIKDFILFGNVSWNWVLCSALIGFIYGLPYKIIDLKYKVFTKKKSFYLWFYQFFCNFIIWGFLAPQSDLLIYRQPPKLVYLQSFLIVISNILAYSAVGMKLISMYSCHYIKQDTLIKINNY
jgi:energy-coupling factor transport system substrate-specific component